MHPAPSIILFTSLSGLGFGLMIFLGLGLPDVTGRLAFVFFALAYLLGAGGLLASTAHLGHPERAWRALSQWRTSWLSREGVLSIATLLVMALYGAYLVFDGTRVVPLGLLGAALSAGTILSTAMIYAQMRSVPRWRHWTTPVLFGLFSLSGGAMLAGASLAAALLLLALGVTMLLNWHAGDRRLADSGSTIGTATGLGALGRVRLLEPPHTGRNYLLREMVHVVGRRHAQRLRLIALLAGAVLPAMALTALPAGHLAVGLALGLHLVGLFAQRWLFFAEAEHVVGLYYGRR